MSEIVDDLIRNIVQKVLYFSGVGSW